MWAQALIAPRTFQSIDIPSPVGQPVPSGDVVLRYLAGSICGSDLPFYRGSPGPPPMIYGQPGRSLHEVVGEVVDAGDTDLVVGQRVVGWAKDESGLAEYFLAQAQSLCVTDDRYSDAEATVIQPLGCVVYAVDQIGDVSGKRVAVIGQGPIGLLFSHVVKARGAREVIGVDVIDRSEFSATFGIDTVIHDSSFSWSQAVSDSQPDIVIEAVGHQTGTMNDAIEAVKPRGFIYAFGVPSDTHYPLSFYRVYRKGLTIKSGNTLGRRAALDAGQKHLIDFPELAPSYITHRFPADQAGAAFEHALAPTTGQMKIVLDPAGTH
jgi:L-iditol 2-dehydrogenase